MAKSPNQVRTLQFIAQIASTLLVILLIGCGAEENSEDEIELDLLRQPVISSVAANNLILAGRAKLGTWQDQCKIFVQSTTLASYGVTVSSNDTSNLYKWTSDTSPQTNMARWLGSYANGRLSVSNLAAGAQQTLSVSVPNADPQRIVLYASTANVTATLSKNGSTTLSVNSTASNPAGGIPSSGTTTGQGTWTLTVKNNGVSTSGTVVAVVLSQSRFESDWRTARRGDIIQLYGGTNSTNRANGGPHTAFVQTDYNDSTASCNSGTSGQDTPHCNWLDSNWASPADQIVRSRRVTIDTMMLMMAYASNYGFTVYRLN